MLEKLAQVFDKVYFTQLYQQELLDDISRLKVKKFRSFDELPEGLQAVSRFNTSEVMWRIKRFFCLPSSFSPIGLLFFFFGYVPMNKEQAKPNLLRTILIGLGTFVFRLVTLLPNIALNIIRLVTEFLPLYLIQSLRPYTAKSLVVIINNDPLLAKLIAGIFLFILAPLYLAATFWYFMGCATTSPIESIHSGFRYGQEFFPNHLFGTMLGLLFSSLSLLTTVAVYTLLFPLVLSYLATVIPQGMSAVAGWITTNCPGLCAWVSSTPLAGYLTSFGLGAEWLMGCAGIATITSLIGSITFAIGYRVNAWYEATFVKNYILKEEGHLPPYVPYLANDVLRTVVCDNASSKSQQLFGVVFADHSDRPKQVLSEFSGKSNYQLL